MSDASEQLREVASWLREAERIVVLTGAGISTESGIPDFRGPKGLWTTNPGAEKMATLSHYVADPEVRRRAWRSRLESPAWKAEPNAGHRALVALERTGRLHTLITQNVDGLHQAAGSSPERVVEIHGTIREVTCSAGDTGSWTGPAPVGDVAVLVVSDDGASVEGSYGPDGLGAERASSTGACGFTSKRTGATCP